jgi:hypothetical protein
MTKTPPWSVLYYKSEDGTASFRDFAVRLRSEPEHERARAQCLAFIRLLKEKGGIFDLDERYIIHPNGQREFLGQFVHILYECYPAEHLVILVNGWLPGETRELYDDTF